MRTLHLLEIFDLIYDIVVKTRLTKTVFVLTVAHINLQSFVFSFFNLSLTDLTMFSAFEFT